MNFETLAGVRWNLEKCNDWRRVWTWSNCSGWQRGRNVKANGCELSARVRQSWAWLLTLCSAFFVMGLFTNVNVIAAVFLAVGAVAVAGIAADGGDTGKTKTGGMCNASARANRAGFSLAKIGGARRVWPERVRSFWVRHGRYPNPK